MIYKPCRVCGRRRIPVEGDGGMHAGCNPDPERTAAEQATWDAYLNEQKEKPS